MLTHELLRDDNNTVYCQTAGLVSQNLKPNELKQKYQFSDYATSHQKRRVRRQFCHCQCHPIQSNAKERTKSSLLSSGEMCKSSLCSCFSIEEIKSTWYSQKEMRAIKKVAANTVRLLTDAPKVVLQRKDLCPDGLLSIREMQSRRKVIDEAQEVVLLEQEFQQLQGSYDEDLLADMYLMCTRKNQLEALERAHSHAQRIKLVLPQGN